jgi:acyl dehydratase
VPKNITKFFFEDFTIGQEFEGKGITLTEASIIEFALSYDPQPFHIDAQAAEQSPFEGLIASGFQTIAITFRSFWETGVMAYCGAGGGGIDTVKWHKPVRPGDTITTTATVLEVIPSRSKPEQGIVRMRYEGSNQKGDKVITVEIPQIMKRAPQI